jgi:hypothetical protein
MNQYVAILNLFKITEQNRPEWHMETFAGLSPDCDEKIIAAGIGYVVVFDASNINWLHAVDKTHIKSEEGCS